MGSHPAYPTIDAVLGKINVVRLPAAMQAHRAAMSGPLVVFDELGYGGDAGQGRAIHLVDLAAGTIRTIATAGGDDAAWVPDIDGTTVVWSEWHYPVLNGGGPLTWKILALDLKTGIASVIASGVNHRLEGPEAIPPLVNVSGDTVAYTIEDQSVDRPMGWKIVLKSIRTGGQIAEYATALSIYQMGLSGTDVVYSEGLVDQSLNFKYKTRLMLASKNSSSPRFIANDAFELSFHGNRFAWVSDPGSSQGQVGLAQHPRVFTATVSDLTPLPVSLEPGSLVRGGVWPVTSDGLVAWSDDELVGPNPPAGNYLALWSSVTRRASAVAKISTIAPQLGGAGWVAWDDDLTGGGTLQTAIAGGRIADIFPSLPVP